MTSTMMYIDLYPLNGSVELGLCDNTDKLLMTWFSPVGFTRGNVRGDNQIIIRMN